MAPIPPIQIRMIHSSPITRGLFITGVGGLVLSSAGAINDWIITRAIPSSSILLLIIMFSGWCGLLYLLRRRITVSRGRVEVMDSLCAILIHSRVIHYCDISNLQASLFGKHWYRFNTLTPNIIICHLRTDHASSWSFKQAVDDDQQETRPTTMSTNTQ